MSEKTEKVEYKTEYCKYEFSEKERRDIAETLAVKTQDLERAEDEKKSVMSSYKDRIDKIGIEIKQAARMYKDGYEMREIECVVERDFEVGVVKYIRTDNGEVARTSKMTMLERQLTIDQAAKDAEANRIPPPGDDDAAGQEEAAEAMRQKKVQREMSSETSAL